jgi:hypothetical protein
MLLSQTPFELIWFHGFFFSWGYNDNCHSGKGWSLLQSVPNGHVPLFSCGGFLMFTPTSRQVFSLMCQHGMGNEGHWRPSSFSFVHIL